MLDSTASIKQRLSDFIKTSMKAGHKNQLSFGRNLHAAIRKKEIDDRIDLDDAGVQKIISTLLKQRHESIEQFKAGARADLVEKEEAEVSFLSQFMPPPLSDSDLLGFVKQAIAQVGATQARDMGKVMASVLPHVQGRADGKKVNQMVREELAKLG